MHPSSKKSWAIQSRKSENKSPENKVWAQTKLNLPKAN